MKIEVVVLGSPSLTSLMVSVDESNTQFFLSELRSCVKIEVVILGSPSLISLVVFADVKQH